MTDLDAEKFEAELKRLRPAPAPEDLLPRLHKVLAAPQSRLLQGPGSFFSIRTVWRRFWWLTTSAAALVIVVALLNRSHAPPIQRVSKSLGTAPRSPALKADQVEIDQHLLSSFDAVAQLPDGEPVRFRCSEWLDRIVVRDSAHGVVIRRQAPRLEIVPVRFETY
jgi:hypothetical protein